jgi:hypothetical protein
LRPSAAGLEFAYALAFSSPMNDLEPGGDAD